MTPNELKLRHQQRDESYQAIEDTWMKHYYPEYVVSTVRRAHYEIESKEQWFMEVATGRSSGHILKANRKMEREWTNYVRTEHKTLQDPEDLKRSLSMKGLPVELIEIITKKLGQVQSFKILL